LEEIEAELGAVSELREKPAGAIRITTTAFAADTVLAQTAQVFPAALGAHRA
jgi:hypothetical protein